MESHPFIELSKDLETPSGLIQPLPAVVLRENQLLSPVAVKSYAAFLPPSNTNLKTNPKTPPLSV